MAVETFIPTVEIAKLMKEVDKYHVFVDHCTREFEGAVKSRGDSVRVTALGKPTLYTLQKDGTYATGDSTLAKNAGSGKGKEIIHRNIGDAEEITGSEFLIQVNQITYWNYMIGQIDKDQSEKKDLLSQYRTKAAQTLADKFDKYVAETMLGTAECAWDSSKVQTITYAELPTAGQVNVLDLIDDVVLHFNESDIPDSTAIVCESTPKFWKVLKKAYRDLDTDNSQLLAGRKCGVYNDVKIFKTNNAKIEDTHYAFFRTTDAVAFVNPFSHIEVYKPEKGFGDAVKGFTLYDCKVIKPKEVRVVKLGFAA